jgi:hypothetical protein
MTAANVVDPMDMDDPFSDPASGGSLDEFKGLVVIIKPTAVSRKASKYPVKGDPTGLIDVVACQIIAVDGPEPGKTVETSSYSGSLNTQIKSKVGSLVIGKLDKKKFDLGMGWNLEPATKEQRAAGKAVLEDIKAKAKAKAKADADDPFEA